MNKGQEIRNEITKKLVKGEVTLTDAMWASIGSFDMAHDGAIGESAEIVLRAYFKRNSCVKSGVCKRSKQGCTDATVSYKSGNSRKRITLEVKTACGELDDVVTSQYIAYCPEVNLDTLDELPTQFAVFSREEWAAMISNWETLGRQFGGRGGALVRKASNGTTHFQSFYAESRPRSSKAIRRYLDFCCGNQPNLDEFINNLRGNA